MKKTLLIISMLFTINAIAESLEYSCEAPMFGKTIAKISSSDNLNYKGTFTSPAVRWEPGETEDDEWVSFPAPVTERKISGKVYNLAEEDEKPKLGIKMDVEGMPGQQAWLMYATKVGKSDEGGIVLVDDDLNAIQSVEFYHCTLTKYNP